MRLFCRAKCLAFEDMVSISLFLTSSYTALTYHTRDSQNRRSAYSQISDTGMEGMENDVYIEAYLTASDYSNA